MVSIQLSAPPQALALGLGASRGRYLPWRDGALGHHKSGNRLYILSRPSKTLAKVQDTPSEPVLPILDIIDHEPQIAKATPVGITPQPISNRHAEIPAEEVDIEEYLRIDQARIDNELALLAAADIEADYQGMLEYLSEEGEALPDDWEITIVNLTME